MILIVCEGNVCRSVLAEALLRKALPLELGITVGSAGTRALVGEPADPMTASIADRLGLSVEDHRARQLTPELLGAAEMVLAVSRQVRSAAVQTYPPAVKYSFTLRQAARILDSAPGGFVAGGLTGPALVAAVAKGINQEKGRLGTPAGDQDDIPDPRGRPARVHEHSGERILAAVNVLAQVLGGNPVAWVSARGLRLEMPHTAAG